MGNVPQRLHGANIEVLFQVGGQLVKSTISLPTPTFTQWWFPFQAPSAWESRCLHREAENALQSILLCRRFIRYRSYFHKQIPDSKFDAYIVDRSTRALNKFGTERDFSEFDKCKQNVWEAIRQKMLENKQKVMRQYGKDPCVVNPALDGADK